MNILITGGTGFVGSHLVNALHNQGHHTYILTRHPGKSKNDKLTTYISYHQSVNHLPRIHAVINLAGDSLFGYWSKRKKNTILTSRINTTQKVIDIIKQMKVKPDVLINGSAVGFYGTSEEQMFSEKTTQPGNDFLAHVATNWEGIAKQAEDLNIRTVYTRFGVILGNKGALPLMSLPIKIFVGGKIGSGEQWTSWVHIDDVVELIIFCLFNEQIEGSVNVTSPNPQRNLEFTKTLSTVLNRPYWFTTPAPLIRFAIGEMSELITEGQYVLPAKATQNDYEFKYPHLRKALEDIFSIK